MATDYSIDKVQWQPIPNGIKVLGSKYAIVCKSIEQCNFSIDLANYVIPIGNSKGKILSNYIRGHVDKACGRYNNNLPNQDSQLVNISLCAEIDYPYSVFLK